MRDEEVKRLLLSLLDILTLIPEEQRQRIEFDLKSDTQNEFRLDLFLSSIHVVETDFLKPELPDNIIQFPIKR